MKKQPAANKMWGGHYSTGPAEIMARINECLDIDKRLYAQDIAGSLAHAQMLGDCGILSAKDVKAIQKGLRQILAEIENGKFVFKTELEDVHMNVESRLAELIGDAAGRLHTARSRNDQVAVDFIDHFKASDTTTPAAAFLDRVRQNDELLPDRHSNAIRRIKMVTTRRRFGIRADQNRPPSRTDLDSDFIPPDQ